MHYFIIFSIGCKFKWKQRSRSRKHHASESDDDDLIDNVLKQMEASIPCTSHDVYRDRPNDDGIVHRVSMNERKRKKETPTTSKGEHFQTYPKLKRTKIIDAVIQFKCIVIDFLNHLERL